MARLGDIATYVNGYAFKPADWSDTGLPIIRIQDLTGNLYQVNRYNGEYDEKYEVNCGDILISWSASLGVYIWSGEKSVLNQHIFKVVFDKAEVNKSFFVHQVQNILENAASQAHGATMKHLTKPVFDALPFNLPPMEEQQRVAAILDKLNNLIFLRKQQLAKLDELVKAQFAEMFGSIIDNPHGFPRFSLEEISKELFAGGDKPADISQIQTEEYLYPVYANGEADLGLQGYTKHYRVDQSAITVSARGTLGFCCIREPFFTPVVRLITLIPQEAGSLIYLKSAIEQTDLKSSGTSQGQLTIPDFRKAEVMFPALDLQEGFAAFVKKIDNVRLTIQQSLDKLEVLKKSLMQEYFR